MTVSNGKCLQSHRRSTYTVHILGGRAFQNKFSELHNQDRGPKGRDRGSGCWRRAAPVHPHQLGRLGTLYKLPQRGLGPPDPAGGAYTAFPDALGLGRSGSGNWIWCILTENLASVDSDVNKDWTCKDKDKDQLQGPEQGQRLDLQGQGQGQGLDSQWPGQGQGLHLQLLTASCS